MNRIEMATVTFAFTFVGVEIIQAQASNSTAYGLESGNSSNWTEFIIFSTIIIVGLALVIPLTFVELKKTGTIRPPNKALLYGAIIVGVVVDSSRVGKILWTAMLHSDLGLSPLSSRALSATIMVSIFMVIAIYIDSFIKNKHAKRNQNETEEE